MKAPFTPRFYRLMARCANPDLGPNKGRRIRIGSGTEFSSPEGDGIVCTIEAMPLAWNGEFIIVAAKGRDGIE